MTLRSIAPSCKTLVMNVNMKNDSLNLNWFEIALKKAKRCLVVGPICSELMFCDKQHGFDFSCTETHCLHWF